MGNNRIICVCLYIYIYICMISCKNIELDVSESSVCPTFDELFLDVNEALLVKLPDRFGAEPSLQLAFEMLQLRYFDPNTRRKVPGRSAIDRKPWHFAAFVTSTLW